MAEHMTCAACAVFFLRSFANLFMSFCFLYVQTKNISVREYRSLIAS
jgi:hypothetical protein